MFDCVRSFALLWKSSEWRWPPEIYRASDYARQSCQLRGSQHQSCEVKLWRGQCQNPVDNCGKDRLYKPCFDRSSPAATTNQRSNHGLSPTTFLNGPDSSWPILKPASFRACGSYLPVPLEMP